MEQREFTEAPLLKKGNPSSPRNHQLALASPPPAPGSLPHQFSCLPRSPGLPTLCKKSGGSLRASRPEEEMQTAVPLAVAAIHVSTEVYWEQLLSMKRVAIQSPGCCFAMRECLGQKTCKTLKHHFSGGQLCTSWGFTVCSRRSEAFLFLRGGPLEKKRKPGCGRGLCLSCSCCSMHDARSR